METPASLSTSSSRLSSLTSVPPLALASTLAFGASASARPSTSHAESPYQAYLARAGTPRLPTPAPAPASLPAQALQFQHDNLRKYALLGEAAAGSNTARSYRRQSEEKETSGESLSSRAQTPRALTSRHERIAARASSRPATGESMPVSTAASAATRANLRAAVSLGCTDLSWSPAARLPPSLAPRALVLRSQTLADEELGWVHSGVFAPLPRERLVTRLHQRNTAPRPASLGPDTEGPVAMPGTSVPPTQSHTRQASSSSIVGMWPSTLSPVVTAPSAPASPTRINLGMHRSQVSWLTATDDTYERELAAREAEEIEAEQRRIQAEYETRKAEAWRRRKRNKVGVALRSRSPELEEGEAAFPALREPVIPTAGAEPEKPAVLVVAPAPSPTAASRAAARAATAPSAPLHSQFSAYDPSIDEGIDIAALPLAFQLPASNTATATAATRANHGGARLPSHGGGAVGVSRFDTIESSIAAQVNKLTSASGPKQTINPPPSGHSHVPRSSFDLEREHALLEAGDLRTTTDGGLDVEEAASLDAFNASRAEAQGLLDRFDSYRLKQVEREATRAADKKLAMAHAQGRASSPLHDEDPVPLATQRNEEVSKPTRPMSPKYMRAPASASTFFTGDAEDSEDGASLDRYDDDAHSSSAGFSGSTPATPSSSLLVPARRQASGVGMAGGRDAFLRMASLRTSGWGSQIARQENKKGGSGRPPPVMRMKSNERGPHNMSTMEGQGPLDDPPIQVAAPEALPSSVPLRDASGAPFARPSSALSQRSWGNRIKRPGLGESAGRGSDARVLIGPSVVVPMNSVLVTDVETLRAQELALERAQEEAEREQRQSKVREQDLEEKEAAQAMAVEVGFRGTPSPVWARSAPLDSDDMGRTLLPGPGQNGAKPPPIDTPHYMKQIDRSVQRATRRLVQHEGAAALDALEAANSSGSSSSIFPKWLFDRPDFQATLKAVPYETCLRVLALYPDERSELHLTKLREWILNRSLHTTIRADRAQLAHSSRNTSSHQLADGHNSASGSKSASRAASRSPSRAVLRENNAQPGTHVITLPPASTDYLSSLPRPILDNLLRVLKTETYAAGETIWRQGKAGDQYVVCVSGKLQARRVETLPSTSVPATIAVLKPAVLAAHSPAPPAPSGLASRRQSQAVSISLAVSTSHRSANMHASPRTGGRNISASPLPPSARSLSSHPPRSAIVSTPTPSFTAEAPTQQETVQLILPGAAFGHERLIETTSHAQVQRKRTLRLWQLLRLSVRKSLCDEEGIYSQLQRVTYGATSGDPTGRAGAQRSTSLSKAVMSVGGGGGTGGGGGSGGGLSEIKVRKDTLVALTDSVVFTISYYAFASIEFEYRQMLQAQGIKFLGHFRFFRTLVMSRLRHLYSLLVPRVLTRNEVVWRQGSNADDIAFIEYGSLSLTREVVVTESHRHPINHTQWSCEESTHILSCRPFAVCEAKDYVGEDLLDSSVRDFTVRCKSDTAKIWLLRKRYTTTDLFSYKHQAADVSRLRRAAAQAAVVSMLAERYPAHHAEVSFMPVDWAASRAASLSRGENPTAAPELHYRGTADLDANGTTEFLYLDAGGIYLRYDAPPALLRLVASSPDQSRRVCRLYTAPTEFGEGAAHFESCFSADLGPLSPHAQPPRRHSALRSPRKPSSATGPRSSRLTFHDVVVATAPVLQAAAE